MAVSSNPNAVGDLRIFSREPQRVSGLTSEFQVNSSTQGFQENAVVTGLQDGGWVITWQSPSGGVDGTGGILGQRYGATGVPIGSEFQISTYSPDAQVIPAVTSLADGGFLVSWESFGQDGSNWGIYGQRFNLSGAAVGSEFQINTYTTGPQTDASVSAIADGGWIVTWSSDGQDGLGYGVFARRYDANGLAANPEFRVNTSASGAPFDPSQVDPTIVGLSDGGWVVTWQFTRQGDASSGIFGQRYDSGGLAVGTEFQVNTSTGRLKLYPSTTALNDGGWIVTWSSDGEDGSNWGIFSRRFNSLGDPVGGEVLVNTTTDSYQIQSSVTVLNDGGWVVVWLSNSQQVGGGADVYGQRFSNNGSPVGVEFLINTTTALDQGVPSVAALSDGGWVVSWHSTDGDGSASGVFAQRYDVNGNRGFDLTIPGEIASAADFTEDRTLYADASLITDPDGVGTINWQWQRSLDNGLTWLNIANAIAANYTLGDADVGNLVRVVGAYTDGLGTVETAYSQPSTAVININDAPVLATAIFNQTAVAGAAWSYQLPSDAFTDPDGDALTYSVKMQDGTPLPDWLTFDAATRTLSGTAPINSLGSFNVLVTASDGPANATDVVAINVTDVLGQLIDGTDANETLTGTAGADVINGLGGSDIIYGRAGDDVLNGGDGYDQLYGEEGSDILIAGAGGSLLDGGEGDDLLVGGDAYDQLISGAGSDVLRSGAGNDYIGSVHNGSGLVTRQIEAGSGDDEVNINHYSSVEATSVDLGEGDDLLTLRLYNSQEVQITLGTGQDRFDLRVIGGTLNISDFAAGPQGDLFDWAALENDQLLGWDRTSNPFGPSGFLRLVQSGADTLLQVDRDGAAVNSSSFTTLAILKNVNAADLTAYNFGGFSPDGSPVVGQLIDGTDLGQTLTGTVGADVINGLGGNDTIYGRAGDDVLNGGDGYDFLYGEGGNDILNADAGGATLNGDDGDDVLNGGDGNDFLIATRGSDVMRGGAGNDRITSVYSNSAPSLDTRKIEAGSGDDIVIINHFTPAPVAATSIDLGEGNDLLTIYFTNNEELQTTLGAGQDRLDLRVIGGTLNISDFAAGPQGDVFDWAMLQEGQLVGWDRASNPFGPSGFLRLVQSGADTLLEIDRDGATGNGSSFTTLAILKNVNAADLTAYNFDSFSPDGTPVVGQLINGTNGDETLTGTAGADVINGFGGRNEIFGRAGDDVLNGGDGYNALYGEGGNDILNAGAGAASLNGGSGDDILNGGDGDDVLGASIGSDVMRGGAGNDRIFSHYENSSLSLDTRKIEAGSGNDVVQINHYGSAPPGITSIDLGEGDDLLSINLTNNEELQVTLGAGQDRVDLQSIGGTLNISDFATGPQGDVFDWAALQNDQLLGWDRTSNPFGPSGFLRLVQSGADTLLQVDRDGAAVNTVNFTTLAILKNVNAADLTAYNFGGYSPQVITYLGTQNADQLVGSDRSDVLDGLAGDDSLTGAAGSDLIDGEDGIDTAVYDGSRGDYTVAANPYGSMSVTDNRAGNPNGTDTLVAVERLNIGGTLYALDGKPLITANGGADAATLSVAENSTPVTRVVATSLDTNASLAYSISGGADAALFQIDPATGELRFRNALDFEAPSDAGADNVYDVQVQASDGTNVDVQAIAVSVTNVNEAPILVAALADQSIAEDTAWSYEVPVATFSDVDGDLLTYTATLAGSTSLPSWLSFDAATRTFSGTPPLNFNGNISLTVTASDGSLTASDAFVLTVTPVNDLPTGELRIQSAELNDPKVNTSTDGYLPTLAVLKDGGWVVTWMMSFGGRDNQVFGQRYSDLGKKIGQEFTIETSAPIGEAFPFITSLSDGGWILTWESFSVNHAPHSTFGKNVYGQRYDQFGATIGSPFQVNLFEIGDQYSPRATSLADGGWVIVWSSDQQDGSGVGVYGQRFDGQGNRIGAEFRANSYTLGFQAPNAITALSDGGWLITWSSEQDGSDLGIYGQRFDSQGVAVGDEFQVNTYTQDRQAAGNVIALADGGWLVSWWSGGQDGSGAGVYGQRYNSDGSKAGLEFRANSYTLNDQIAGRSSTAALTDGGWVMTWTSSGQDGSGAGVYGQRYDADGVPVGDEFAISSYSQNGQYSASVASLNDGGWLVTYWSEHSGGTSVYVQRFDVNGNKVLDEFSEGKSISAVSSEIQDADGLGAISWQWQRSTDSGTNWSDISDAMNGSYTLGDLDVGNVVRVRATYVDAQGAIETLYSLASTPVINVNDAPILTVAIADQASTEDTAWSYQLPAGTFNDIDSPALSYTASRAVGNVALPTWLAFDAATRTFSGTPPLNFNGNISLTVTASDGSLSASDTFVLTVNPVEDEATGIVAVNGTVAEGGTVGVDVNFTDVDGAITGTTYQWQISSNGTEGWTNLSGATAATYAIASDQSQVGKYLRVVATTTDALGGTTEFTSAATAAIANVNDAPVIAALIADQSVTEDATFNFVVPAGSFADVDPGDVLTLSASLADGSPLPAWLSFNAATGTFSGTPLRGDVGTVSVRVTATDVGGLRVSDDFNLTVAPETIAPTAIITDNVPGTAIGTVLYTVTFSETVTGLAANDFVVTNGTVSSVTGSGTSYVVAVAPTAGFEGSLALSLNAAAVIDKAGNANAAVNAAAQLVDTRAPVLTTITPAADSIGVAVATNISLAYSEGVRAGTGVIELRTAAGVLVESFNVATSNRLSFTGSTLTIDPTASLNGGTQYRLTVPQGAVLDTAGNAAAALATYAFTTQALVNIINGTAVANTLNGTAGDDEIYGLGGNDTLNGNAGNDLLDGGSGADQMAGGAGNDIYVVDNAGDVVTEAANAGIDLVRTTRNNYTLTNNVENLTYVGDATFTGTGNGLANRIQGGIGNDLIDGGAGADTMIGGIGNDRYVVDNVGDVVVEQASEGTDMVTASMSYVLGANVENLTLSGNAAINGTGNAVANIITGNNGANILRGAGGADTLNGGAGTDTAAFEQAVANYAIDHSGTAIIVSDLVGGEGTDTLTAIETLSFLGSSYNVVTGTGAANVITGGAGSQAIFGLGGADTINGGAGNDIVIGGLGNDNISMASDTGGRDFIDGGAGEDTFTLLTATGAENFVIYTRAAAQQAIAGLIINPNSEIVITRNGAVMAELDNVEEIVVSSLRVTSPAGANGGAVAGDTVQVVGDFNQTSLNFNTITVNGTNASDTVDITGLQSEHRIVFTGNGGTDNVVGNLRPQDIFVTDSVAATTSLTASLAASAATSVTTSAATSAITSTSASLQALKQAAVISAEPVTDDTSPQMHRLHHKEADDSVTSLLRDMFDDSKSGSLFRHWDATDKRQEARIDDHPDLRHDAGKDDIKLYDDSWSDVLIRRPDSWHAEFEHLM